MHFDFSEVATYPRLAWLATISRHRPRIEVRHGVWVERTDSHFAEGVWRGPFAAGGFATADVFLGSGGATERGRIVFATSTHSLERIYWLRQHSSLYVSNSLVVLLAETGEQIKIQYPYYDVDLRTFTLGTRRAITSFPLASGRQFRTSFVQNLVVHEDMSVRLERKEELKPQFHDYHSYYEYVLSMLSDLTANAADRHRRVRYQPLSTLSSGYDSPACAVLGREVGCRRAVTITHARQSFGNVDDSGARIGDALGLNVHCCGQDDYRRRDDQPEVPFLATGMGGPDVVFSNFAEQLPRSLLITGFLGDTVWSTQHVNRIAAREHHMLYPAGSSLSEFRLRLGFVHLPLPQIQRPIHPAIRRLSVSNGMSPWRLRNEYDRPIPRRIVEEAGIPRGWFGQTKKAVSQPFHTGDDLKRILSSESYDSFCNWLGSTNALSVASRPVRLGVRQWLYDLNRKFQNRLDGPLARLKIPIPSYYAGCVPERYRFLPEAPRYLFHWAINELLREFDVANQTNVTDAAARHVESAGP